jgi:hypothetical protein
MGDRIFPILLVLAFFVVWEAADPKHPVGWGLLVPGIAFLLYFWADGFFVFFDEFFHK